MSSSESERLEREQPNSLKLGGATFKRAVTAVTAVTRRTYRPGHGAIRFEAEGGELGLVAASSAGSPVQIARARIQADEGLLEASGWLSPPSLDEGATQLFSLYGQHQPDVRLFEQSEAEHDLYLSYDDWSGPKGLRTVDEPTRNELDDVFEEHIENLDYGTTGRPDGYQLRGAAVGMAAAAESHVGIVPYDDELTFVSEPLYDDAEHVTWTIEAPGIDGNVDTTFVSSGLLAPATAAISRPGPASISLGDNIPFRIEYSGVETWTAPRIPQDGLEASI